jgi:protein SCO1/2
VGIDLVAGGTIARRCEGGGAMEGVSALGPDAREDEIAAVVDEIRRTPGRRDALVGLLSERQPLYAGRGANATTRIRGYVLAAFEQVGLPPAAIPYVLEELESGRDAYLVAAAARALRGLERPTGEVVPLLLAAIENVWHVDDAVTFDGYWPSPSASHTTAIREVLATLAWLGGRAAEARPRLAALRDDRAALPAATRAALERAIEAVEAAGPDARAAGHRPGPAPISLDLTVGRRRAPRPDAPAPSEVPLEDQDGRSLTYGDFFGQGPSIVAFFYTRCDNPNKCSLTITRLGQLQRRIADQRLDDRLRTAAITYDPEYDRPPRLRAYGQTRGVTFDERNRFFRTRGGLETLRDYFELGVSFGQASVNRHAIELFVLDERGRLALAFSRRRWEVDDVLDQARARLPAPATGHPSSA